MGTHSYILAWRIPWTIPWGHKELDMNEMFRKTSKLLTYHSKHILFKFSLARESSHSQIWIISPISIIDISYFCLLFYWNGQEIKMLNHNGDSNYFYCISDFIFFSFIFISWRLISLQCCSGFCHTLTWISHGFTYIPHPDPPQPKSF